VPATICSWRAFIRLQVLDPMPGIAFQQVFVFTQASSPAKLNCCTLLVQPARWTLAGYSGYREI
ncbi:MAG TPA: hypothetical protein VHM64_10455, partial [Candidatus Binatia bacterium]|nr:hypothetical protein [Candidatus Binatia bacterium]